MDTNSEEFITICEKIEKYKFINNTITDIDQSIIDKYIYILEKIVGKKWDDFKPEDTKYLYCTEIADVRNSRLFNNL